MRDAGVAEGRCGAVSRMISPIILFAMSIQRRLRGGARKTRGFIVWVKERVRLHVIAAASKSRILTTIYYQIVRVFDDEMASVAQGIARYYDRDDKCLSNVLLRRNIHRLEKGLCMRPRRALFGEGYIAATVEAYRSARAAAGANINNEVRWAHSVLGSYFRVIAPSPVAESARISFAEVETLDSERAALLPYPRGITPDTSVTYPGLSSLAIRRRSVRWYLPKKVPRLLLDQAVELARYAPSACNRQPFQYLIFDDPRLVRELAKLPLGTSGWRENIPVIIAVVGNQSDFFNERDRHVIYIDSALSVMLFLQGLETLGLSSCIINWGDNRARNTRISRFLRLRGDQRVVMLIAVGYADPDGMVPYSAKKEVSILRRYNFEAGSD